VTHKLRLPRRSLSSHGSATRDHIWRLAAKAHVRPSGQRRTPPTAVMMGGFGATRARAIASWRFGACGMPVTMTDAEVGSETRYPLRTSLPHPRTGNGHGEPSIRVSCQQSATSHEAYGLNHCGGRSPGQSCLQFERADARARRPRAPIVRATVSARSRYVIAASSGPASICKGARPRRPQADWNGYSEAAATANSCSGSPSCAPPQRTNSPSSIARACWRKGCPSE
jgi:hypothetical protein